MNNNKLGYLAIDMGLGKTRIIIEHARKTPGPFLVVAPMRVAVDTWPRELAKWAPELTYTVLHGTKKDVKFKSDCKFYIINYEGLQWLIRAIELYGGTQFNGGTLVFDEASMAKSYSSSRFKLLKGLRPKFNSVYMLSATPSPNGLHDLWAQYFLLDYGESLGHWVTLFINRYFIISESRSVRLQRKEYANEIAARIAPKTFRLDAEDYLKLPDFIDNDIYIDLPRPIMDAYKELKQEFVLALSEATTITAMSASTLSMKLRQLIQGALYTEEGYEVMHAAKLDALEQVITELNGSPTLVPIQFKFELEELRKRFGKLPAITGGLKADESSRLISQWNAGDLPVLICHPASISHGVNLQDGGHTITWLALTWNFEHYKQLNGRLRRQGQTKTVVRNRLLANCDIERKMAAALHEKGATQQNLLDVLKKLSM